MSNIESNDKLKEHDLKKLKYFLWFVGASTLVIGLTATWRHTVSVSSVLGEVSGREASNLGSMIWQDWLIFAVLIAVVETVFYISYRLAKRQSAVIKEQAQRLLEHSQELEATVTMRGLKLRETEERLKAVLAGAPVVIWMTDDRGVFTLSEGSGLKVLGLEPGKVVGKTVAQIYKSFPQIIENNRRALAGETFTSKVNVNDHAFISNYMPVRDGSGRINGMLGVALALIANEQVTKELKLAEERYAQMVNFFPFGLVINKASSGEVAFVNPAAVKMFGAKNEKQLIGKKAIDFVHPDFQEISTERMNLLRLNVPVATINQKFVRLDGAAFDVEVSSRSFDFGGEPAFLVIFRDITGVKEAEEKLRRTHDLLQSVVQSVPSAIIGIDRGGSVTIWNPAAERLFGWKQADVLGKKLPIIPEDKEEQFAKTSSRVMAGKMSESFTETCLRKDGGELKCTFWPAPVRDADRAVTGAYVMVEKGE